MNKQLTYQVREAVYWKNGETTKLDFGATPLHNKTPPPPQNFHVETTKKANNVD